MKLSTVVFALAVVGCGGGGGNAPADAPREDASPEQVDARVDGPGQAVTVTVGPPLAGVAVYFQNADSTLVAKVMTDATGTASQVMAPGGFVTVVDAYYTLAALRRHDIHTWADVKPGDALHVESFPQGFAPLTVTEPTMAGATVYELHATGTDPDFIGDRFSSVAPPPTGNPTDQLTIYNSSQTDVLVVADTTDGASYVYAPDQVTNAASNAIDLTGLTYAPLEATTWTLNNLPSDQNDFPSVDYLITNHGLVYNLNFDPATDVNHKAVKTLTRPPVGLASLLAVDVTSPTNVGRSYLFDWTTRAAAETFDYQNRRLRDLTHAVVFDQATHAFTWTEGATGVEADVTQVRVDANRTDGSVPLYWTWDLAAPHSATGAVLPVLAGDAAQFNVVATDSAFIEKAQWAKLPGGYDVARSYIFGRTIFAVVATGATGQGAYQTYKLPQ
ncbi:MAG TPA: hypothetical protein VGM90_16100 [Kofleriaceae bacterium]|jgi:hypothetical protein